MQPRLRDQLYIALDLLNGLPSQVLAAVAEQLITGLSVLTKDHRNVIRCVKSHYIHQSAADSLRASSSTEWSLVFALIRGAASHYVAGKPAFDLVSDIVSSTSKDTSSRMDHLAGLIAILEEFAMVPSRALASRNPRRPAHGQQAVSLQ